ncbi:MAG: hypothetical protein P4L46_12430 [Fimbriimonas sp.]|nr:hypothetical protein [Fimbriimonas sp.]
MTFLILGILGGLIHVSNEQVHLFEKHAATDIAQRLDGPNRRVEVKANVGPEALWGDIHSVAIHASGFRASGLPFFTEPKRSQRGLVRDLQIDLTDFSLGKLHVQKMQAEIPDCHFDFPLAVNHRKIRLSRSGVGHGEVVVGQDDLEQFVLAKYHEIRRVSVKIDKDKIFIDGTGEFLIFKASFTVIARLECIDGNTLHLTHARVLIDGLPADEGVRKVLLDVLDPVVDVDRDLDLHGAIRVQGLTLRDGQLRAEGVAVIPDAPSTGSTEKSTPLGHKL